MAMNHIQNAIPAAISFGKGIVNAICGWQSSVERAASSLEAVVSRGLTLSRGYRYALSLKRMQAAMTPATIPADMATCWSTTDGRHQRHQRWMSGVVVVDPGTVGVA